MSRSLDNSILLLRYGIMQWKRAEFLLSFAMCVRTAVLNKFRHWASEYKNRVSHKSTKKEGNPKRSHKGTTCELRIFVPFCPLRVVGGSRSSVFGASASESWGHRPGTDHIPLRPRPPRVDRTGIPIDPSALTLSFNCLHFFVPHFKNCLVVSIWVV